MKRIIPFSKYYIPGTIVSVILAVFGLVGYLTMGFNRGVDFQPGLLQEIEFAPTAFQLTYNGPGNATISFGRNSLDIVMTGTGVEQVTHSFPFADYPTQADMVKGLRGVEGIGVTETAQSTIQSSWLVQSAQGNPQLGTVPFVLHYLTPGAPPVPIEDVRSSLLPLGTVSVQILGTPPERRFMIRMEDKDMGSSSGGNPSAKIVAALESSFGKGEVAIISSNYVGSRFSKQLTDQAGYLMLMTCLIIGLYSAFRFRVKFAVGIVIAMIHDGIILVTFIVWTRMDFNTTTIAAILTILGYSINDKIVIFDRMKETRQIYPDDSSVNVMNRAITETMSRTIITTLTTMLAVLSLYIFTRGDMKNFALALLVGMASAVYSTIFIAAGWVHFWDWFVQRWRAKKKLVPSRAKA
ncbi:MAG: protein translocase subunit SecF [Treponema sp.]|nr:protein translocase subunit SecF [Treponema sp.]